MTRRIVRGPLVALLAAGVAVAVPTFAMDDQGMQEACQEQVLEVHSFFEKLLNREAPLKSEDLHPFMKRLEKSFIMVAPGGAIYDKDKLAAALVEADQEWMKRGKVHIEIKFLDYRDFGGKGMIFYREINKFDDGTELKRIGSALMKRDDEGNIRWLAAQEVPEQ